MRAIQFFRPILRDLDQGNVICTAVAYALRSFGVLTVLVGVYMLIVVLKVSFQLPTQGTIGGLLFAIILAAGIACLFQIFFYRAESIRDLSPSPFSVIAIFSILSKTQGELYATCALAMGVGGCIFEWLSGTSPTLLFQGLGISPPATGVMFIDGLSTLVWGVVTAFVVLIFFYFIAEAVMVIVDIALNTRLLVQQGEASGGEKGTR